MNHAFLRGQNEKGLQLMEDYFKDDYLMKWQDFNVDPIYDPVRNHPKFRKIMGEVEAKVATQRESFRAFLKAKG